MTDEHAICGCGADVCETNELDDGICSVCGQEITWESNPRYP